MWDSGSGWVVGVDVDRGLVMTGGTGLSSSGLAIWLFVVVCVWDLGAGLYEICGLGFKFSHLLTKL